MKHLLGILMIGAFLLAGHECNLAAERQYAAAHPKHTRLHDLPAQQQIAIREIFIDPYNRR